MREILGCSLTELDGVHGDGNRPSNLTSLQVSMSAGNIFDDRKGPDQVVKKNSKKQWWIAIFSHTL